MKNKIPGLLIFLIILFGFLFVYRFSYAARARAIDYIPRDQELVTTEKNYATPYNIGEVDCSDYLVELNSKISRCNECIQLKNQCSDCCINMTGTRQTKCKTLTDAANALPPVFQPATSGNSRARCTVVNNCVPPSKADPGSTDTSYNAFKAYCSDSSLTTGIPGCQALGCPDNSGAPEQHGSDQCISSTTNPGAFICNTDSIDELASEGCNPVGTAVTDCTDLSHSPVVVGGGGKGGVGSAVDNGLYIITEMDDADCPVGYTRCWEYALTTGTNGLRNCIDNCKTVTDLQEQAAKNLDCCQRDSNICCNAASCLYGIGDTGISPRIRPGYQNNCTNNDACLSRVNWPECLTNPSDEFCCDNLDVADCITLSQEKDELLEDMVSGTNLQCFLDISKSDDEFIYEFVAKSNEKLMIIWQIQTSPEYFYCGASACTTVQENTAAALTTLPSTGTAPNTYFYTLIKIFDETDGNVEVYPHPYADTVMNQKSFTASFSVFAAVATGKDNANPAKSIFKQGHKYKVKLYYLIAPLSNYVLRSKISQLQLLVLRIRE